MKKIIILLAVLSGLKAVSQNLKPISIQGKVTVEGGDLTGISIFNKTSKIGTITNENGEFTLPVKLNDSIEVSALQFKNIGFLINQGILQAKTMKIFLIDEINKLDEVVITGNSLSKNLEVQMKRTGNFKPKLNNLYFGMVNNDEAYNDIDYKSAVSNNVMNSQRQKMIHGLNVVNVVDQLLLPLFRSKVKDKDETGIPEVPIESVKYYFGFDFLVDNFNIPEHRVEEFIRYVESDNFDMSLLNYGKEMELLELIHNKSLQFLNKK
ncbi:carboxypeptidase-like regulatory domain-containing protein [Yeosuana marina]|uniref:carboxypeptidase-like regulatory domain-containing protein n=1 Tax=Yeosuana marina TaxID=1565536 RepID=UPI0030ED7094|tara:strand:- start:1246 stop:2043 length:798 start_codon:yes stop_codon:yes gene_type:complete